MIQVQKSLGVTIVPLLDALQIEDQRRALLAWFNICPELDLLISMVIQRCFRHFFESSFLMPVVPSNWERTKPSHQAVMH